MRKSFILALCIILCISFVGCGNKTEKLFEDIQKKYDDKDWSTTITLAEGLIEKYPDSSEAILAKELIDQAKEQQYLEAASAVFAQAEAERAAGNQDSAIEIAEGLVNDYPDAPEAENVKDFVMNCNAEKAFASASDLKDSGNYKDAIEQLNKLIRGYPDATVLDEAKSDLEECKELRVAELLEETKEAYAEEDWDQVISLEKEITSLIATGEAAAEARRLSTSAAEIKAEARRLKLIEELNTEYAGEKWADVKLTASTLLNDYPKFDERETVAAYLEEAEAALEQKAIEEARKIVRISRLWFNMNSVGGAELHINFVNNSNKTIKYLTYGVKFYNGVGDLIKPDYERKEINYCQATGPFEKGQGFNDNWSYWGPYYNSTIKTVELVYVEIEYMDGTSKRLSDDQVKYVQY